MRGHPRMPANSKYPNTLSEDNKMIELAVIYDDRDKNNKGWYARIFERKGNRLLELDETTRNMPCRSNAFRLAIRVAKREFSKYGEPSEIRVYNSIHHDNPDMIFN